MKPEILNVLFSLRNGLFSHHPILFIGLVGIFPFLMRVFHEHDDLRLVIVGLCLVFGFQIYVNSIVADWWSGHSFGQRRLISSFPFFAFGLAWVIDWVRHRYEMVYAKFGAMIVTVFSALGLYLTMIHVFYWDYNEPHNILAWMLVDAPRMFLAGQVHPGVEWSWR